MYSDVSLMMSDGLGGKAASSMWRMILKHQLMMEESVRKLSDLIRLPRWNRAERKPLSEQRYSSSMNTKLLQKFPDFVICV